jgi:hypothetical protein
MNKQKYLESAFEAFTKDKISEEVYDAMLLQINDFCDEEDEDND